MKLNPQQQRWFRCLTAFTLVALLSPAALAQEDEEGAAGDAQTERGSIMFQLENWVAQPAGLEYDPATRFDPNVLLGTTILGTDHGTEEEVRYQLGFTLPKNWGQVTLSSYQHEDRTGLSESTPGFFVFGEILANPLYAGVYNDGLADAFDASTITKLEDWHLDYSRQAFAFTRVKGDWFVGWRRVTHERQMLARYYALAANDVQPPLPPVCDIPCPDLSPEADLADVGSRFEGRGINAGMNFDLALLEDKLSLEGGIALSVLRGNVDSFYRSETHFYQLDGETLTPPYVEFNTDFEDIQQESLNVGLRSNSRSQSSQVMEGFLGVRWDALRWVQVVGGFRTARYDDVGVDLRPKVNATLGGTNVSDVTEVDRSATYEGFYAGVRLHFDFY